MMMLHKYVIIPFKSKSKAEIKTKHFTVKFKIQLAIIQCSSSNFVFECKKFQKF